MAIRSIFFDLDDTLVIEGAAADAAFLATCAHAQEKHGIDAEAHKSDLKPNFGGKDEAYLSQRGR
jgi:FMN phosphatase YigB (HAD superfamily)